jgi:hypothetical protein
VKAHDLIDAARRATGMEDFGDDSFRDGLDVLVRSLETEADLNDHGREAIERQLAGTLSTRLRIEDCYRRHPEIDDQDVPAPVFQLGLPRTGTTALGNLLAQDPAIRYLRIWEGGNPIPPPDIRTRDDPRIAETEAALLARRDTMPKLRSMLPSSATGPGECLALMSYQFQSASLFGAYKVPSYSEWLFASDMVPAYRYHERMLKLLQWKTPPNRWRLRTPAHMMSIEALDEVYPDAQFVMTHRDVASVIPSVADLHTTLSVPNTDHPDPEYFGRFCAQMWATALARTIAFRDSGRERRFHDLGFREVQQDPVGSVRKLYASLGEELSPDTEERMATWWADNPRDRYGRHTYHAEEFGLTAAGLRERFAFYTERFDVPLDD